MADEIHWGEKGNCSPDQGCYGRTIQDRATAFEMVFTQGFFESLVTSSYLTQFAILFVFICAIAVTAWIVSTAIYPGFRQKIKDLWEKLPGYVVDDVDFGTAEDDAVECIDPVYITESVVGRVINKCIKKIRTDEEDLLESKSPEDMKMLNEYIVYVRVEGYEDEFMASNKDNTQEKVYGCRTDSSTALDRGPVPVFFYNSPSSLDTAKTRVLCDIDSIIYQNISSDGYLRLNVTEKLYNQLDIKRKTTVGQLDIERKTAVNISLCYSWWNVSVIDLTAHKPIPYEEIINTMGLALSIREEEKKELYDEDEFEDEELPPLEPVSEEEEGTSY